MGEQLGPPNDFQKLLHLFKHRHTRDQYDRQATTVESICRQHPNGFFLRDLESVSELIDICCEMITNGHEQFVDPMCKLLQTCTIPFIKEYASDEYRNFPMICKTIAAIVNVLHVPNPEVHSAAAEMLTLYASSSDDTRDSLSYHHQVLENSDIAKSMAQAVIDAADNPLRRLEMALLLRQLSLSVELSKDLMQHGAMNSITDCFTVCDYMDPVVSVVVETVWNIVETCPGAPEELANTQTFDNCKVLFENLLRRGHRDQDKQLRNELLAILYHLSKVKDRLHLFFESGLLDIILTVSVAAETQAPADVVHPLVLTSGALDFEMKISLISLVSTLCSDEQCFESIVESPFMPALLLHLDSGLDAHPARTKYPLSAEHSLITACLNALSVLIPLAPDQFQAMDGNRVLLELLAAESDEAVRYGVLKVLLNTASFPPFQDELGQLGAVGMMLSLVNDTGSHPFQLRQDAVAVLADLCYHHTANAQLFGQLYGVETMLSCLDSTPQDADRKEPMALSVVDCIWSAVCGNQVNEATFIHSNGINALLTLLEVCPELMQSQVLSCLSDFLESTATRPQVVAWKSRVTRRGAVALLLDLWHKQEVKLQQERRLYDLGEGPAPAVQGDLDSATFVDSLTRCNLRTKLFAVLRRLDVQDVRQFLTTEQKVSLVTTERYVDTEQDKLWRTVAKELEAEEIRPVTPDARAMQARFAAGQGEEVACAQMKKLLQDEDTKAQLEAEQAFFERLKLEHAARLTNTNRLRQPPKPPYVSRTKVIIPRIRGVDDEEGEAAADQSQGSESAPASATRSAVASYLDECLADGGVDTLLAATSARQDAVNPFSEVKGKNNRRTSFDNDTSSAVDDSLEDSLVAPINGPRGSGMEAARKLERDRRNSGTSAASGGKSSLGAGGG
eukprot:CAMPEP_0114555898 /NCGR_PEP_ID=MMETSP0114-20121206/8994_1 /TAXON_ID=31324 /ORGANISM="Goniomonas sp, Strain m" /LENGTH=904 /DNA_ID=CAMNT_0001741053 /DNA_START=109 /DNA_END=2820 /DNA_ORIENTATION=+